MASQLSWRKYLSLQRNQLFCEKKSSFLRVAGQEDIIECAWFFFFFFFGLIVLIINYKTVPESLQNICSFRDILRKKKNTWFLHTNIYIVCKIPQELCRIFKILGTVFFSSHIKYYLSTKNQAHSMMPSWFGICQRFDFFRKKDLVSL